MSSVKSSSLMLLVCVSLVACAPQSGIPITVAGGSPDTGVRQYLHEAARFVVNNMVGWAVERDEFGFIFDQEGKVWGRPCDEYRKGWNGVSVGVCLSSKWHSLEDARKGVKGLCAEYAKSYKSLPPIPCSVTERQARIGNAKGFEFIVEAGTSVSGNAVYYDGFIVKGYVLLRGVNEVYVTNYWAPMPWLYRTYHEQADVSMQSLRFVVKTTYDAEGVPRAISSVTVDEASYAGDDLPRIMWLEYKSAHRLSVEAVLAEAETRYLFDIWNDGSHDISRTIAIEPDDRGGLSYVARYVAQYHLTVRSDHGDPQGDGWYDSGTVATISVNSPVPEAGIMGILGGRYLFASWKGDRGFSSTEPVTRINVTEPQVVAPIWREDYSITYTGIAMVYGVIIAAGLFTLLVQPDRVTPRATPERTKVKFCRFCGAKILPDSKYCKECGTKLS